MSIQSHRDMLCGTNSVYYTTDGVMPTSGGQFQVGDFIVGLGWNAGIWQCVSASPSPSFVPLVNAGVNPVSTTSGITLSPTSNPTQIITSAGNITLPTASTFPKGFEYMLVSNNVALTVTPAAGNINGLAAMTVAAGKAAVIFSDGTNWYSSSTA